MTTIYVLIGLALYSGDTARAFAFADVAFPARVFCEEEAKKMYLRGGGHDDIKWTCQEVRFLPEPRR